MELTFLTTTSATPVLGRTGAKQVRAHVTRANFARRRERLAVVGREHRIREKEGKQVNPQLRHSQSADSPESMERPPATPLPLVGPTDPEASLRQVLDDYRLILFPSGAGASTSLAEHDWSQLMRSEPALLEALLSLTAIQRSPGQGRPGNIHLFRAVRMMSKRLEDESAAVSDGALGAVFTLAFHERAARNLAASNVHEKGLAQMLQIRRAKSRGVPAWFSDTVLYDAISEQLSSGEILHRKTIDALERNGSKVLSEVSRMSKDFLRVRQMLDLSHQYDMPPEFLSREIDEPLARMQAQAHSLRCERASINALSMAIVIFLHLSWERSPLSPAALGQMAAELKETFEKREIRLCTALQLTSWQLMVGAVSASEFGVRSWFVDSLRQHLTVVQAESWEDALGVLRRTFMPDARLLGRFRTFWEEEVIKSKAESESVGLVGS